ALWQRAFHDHERAQSPAGAARCAGWLGMDLMQRGDMAQASGWIARARRLAADTDDAAVNGYLMLPGGMQALFGGGNPADAEPIFAAALEIGERAAEPDLTALGRLGLGNTLVALGRRVEGLALLDDVMISVTAGEVSPYVSGIVYCAVIEACHAILDLRRA